MIELRGLSKAYGATVAVDDLTADVQPGRVTGFLGPNGAGKSTTMRMIVGLSRPTSGTVLVNHRRLDESPAPLCEIGAVLDARAMQPNRTARQHLQIMAVTHGVPMARVDELLAVTGLSSVAGMRIGAYSLGMGQRLAIATALLGDPQVLIFDEPINGLDPEGVAWVRALLRQQASLGKTVLVSSHLMSEMEHTADHLLIVGRGRLLADVGIAEFIAGASGVACRIDSPQADAIVASFAGPGVQAVSLGPGSVELRGVDARQVAERAAQHAWVVYRLVPVEVNLEDAYLQLTSGAVDYVSGGTTVSGAYATAGPAWRPIGPTGPYQAPPPAPEWSAPASAYEPPVPAYAPPAPAYAPPPAEPVPPASAYAPPAVAYAPSAPAAEPAASAYAPPAPASAPASAYAPPPTYTPPTTPYAPAPQPDPYAPPQRSQPPTSPTDGSIPRGGSWS